MIKIYSVLYFNINDDYYKYYRVFIDKREADLFKTKMEDENHISVELIKHTFPNLMIISKENLKLLCKIIDKAIHNKYRIFESLTEEGEYESFRENIRI
jgi:hypothetical protein